MKNLELKVNRRKLYHNAPVSNLITCDLLSLNLPSTTALLTLFLIGSYHEMFTCVANYDITLKMLHSQTCA